MKFKIEQGPLKSGVLHRAKVEISKFSPFSASFEPLNPNVVEEGLKYIGLFVAAGASLAAGAKVLERIKDLPPRSRQNNDVSKKDKR